MYIFAGSNSFQVTKILTVQIETILNLKEICSFIMYCFETVPIVGLKQFLKLLQLNVASKVFQNFGFK